MPWYWFGADINTGGGMKMTANPGECDFHNFLCSIRIGYDRGPHVTITVAAERAVGSPRNRK